MADNEFKITDKDLPNVKSLGMIFFDVVLHIDDSGSMVTGTILSEASHTALEKYSESEGVQRLDVKTTYFPEDNLKCKAVSGMAYKNG